METRRKAAEAQRLRQEEEDRRAALALQEQLEKEAKDDAKYRQQLEQERRDHELALRLANLFADLYSMYKSVLPPELVSLPARTFCEAMFQSLNLSAKDFKFGITKVFFRPGKFVEFDRIMRSDPENMLAIVAKVKKWLIRSRWVKSALGALCVIKRKLSYKLFYIISS